MSRHELGWERKYDLFSQILRLHQVVYPPVEVHASIFLANKVKGGDRRLKGKKKKKKEEEAFLHCILASCSICPYLKMC